MLQSMYQDSIRLPGGADPLVGFHPADRPDLHHTSAGVDGRTGRNLSAPKHTSAYAISAQTNCTLRPHLLTWFSPSPPSHPPTRPLTPLSFCSSLSDSPGTMKSSELSEGMSDDCVEQSAKHTHTPTRCHTHIHETYSQHSFLFPEQTETFDTALDWVTLCFSLNM